MSANNDYAGQMQQQQKQAEQQKEKEEQANEMRNQILSQVLDQPARARLNTLMLAKPSKGAQVEALLINMARMGQLRQKIGEDELVGLLEKISENSSGGGGGGVTVKFNRRKVDSDDDEDDYDL